MANTSVTGIIVDETGQPWIGLNIDSYDNDALGYRDKLGSAITDGNGRFHISYPSSKYGPIEKQPDIQIEVWNPNRTVFIYKTREFPNITNDELDVGTIQIGGGDNKNTSLTGRVIDENNQGIAGLVIVGVDTDDSPEKLLGRTITDGQGRYGMAYSPVIYGWKKDPYPDIIVRVYDKTAVRLLYETQVFHDIAVPLFTLPDIQLQRALTEGWLVTLGDTAPIHLSTNNHVVALVDNEDALQQMITSIKNAKSSIWIMQLVLAPDCIATYASPTPAPDTSAQPIDILADALLQAHLSGTLGSFVSIKILLDATTFHHSILNKNIEKLKQFFANGGAATNRLTVRGVDEMPSQLHAKMMLIDGAEAYIIGSPFENEYWDSILHRINEPRRPKGVLHGRPVHDVSLRITGQAIKDLEDFFIEVWNHRDDMDFGGRDHLSPHRFFPTSPTNDQSLQIVRTVPAGFLPGLVNGETGILEAYQRAIAESRSLIYIENQYFSSRDIYEALHRALQSNPSLEIIMVLNENPDIPPYKYWQNIRLSAMGFENHPRLGVFSLWSANPSTTNGVADINQIYIHSKVAIVDDKWATIGTANLDGISQNALALVDINPPTSGPFSVKRSFEVNAAIIDGVAGQRQTGNVASIRRQLWSEHLGIPQANLVTPPSGGWLQLWRDVAAANIASLNSTTPPRMTGRILPYSRHSKAKSQLNDAGVDINPTRLNVL